MSDAVSRKAGLANPKLITLPSPLLLAVFASSLFLSALLLFAVQPMFARTILPVLGGSPAVWSVAMCFFQVALLAGYAYAHLLNSALRTPRAVIVHLGVLFAAMFFLPLGIATGWTQPPNAGLHLWTFGLLTVSIGLPFFALAGNAPLLQAWFARTGHKHAADPYFLYGASNLGSLLALLSYPFLIEPAMTLAEQSEIWSLGYKVLTLGVGLCGLSMLLSRSSHNGPADVAPDAQSRSFSPWRERLTWAGLAFVPSGLLVAVTSHITTDVAATPFLWVVPLALFLLTFVITFQRNPILPHKWMLAIQPTAVALLIISMQLPLTQHLLVFIGIHLGAFFVSAMVCHGELVRRRPCAQELTGFYLWMSAGGAAGGLFAGLIAPNIFSTVLEYPIMVVLALFARPGFFSTKPSNWIREGGIAISLLALLAIPEIVSTFRWADHAPIVYVGLIVAMSSAVILSRLQPLRLAMLVAVVLIAGDLFVLQSQKNENHRGFFGVHKISETDDGKFRVLSHGTTIHGAQRLEVDHAEPPEPLTYYHRTGPFADVLTATRSVSSVNAIGVIGLGAGTLACYRQSGETWTFFEIDPLVVRIASDPQKFRFLSHCAPASQIVLGDARITITKEEDRYFDILIVDAFSSDAIPVHLLTREALEAYLSKLSETGVLALHISNRHMDLGPVIAAAARELGLIALTRHSEKTDEMKEAYKSGATLAVLARNAADVRALRGYDGWKPLEDRGWRVWTDDYSNVLAAILAKHR